MKNKKQINWDNLLTQFTAKLEDYWVRKVFLSPFNDENFTYATNSRIAIRVAKQYIDKKRQCTADIPNNYST